MSCAEHMKGRKLTPLLLLPSPALIPEMYEFTAGLTEICSRQTGLEPVIFCTITELLYGASLQMGLGKQCGPRSSLICVNTVDHTVCIFSRITALKYQCISSIYNNGIFSGVRIFRVLRLYNAFRACFFLPSYEWQFSKNFYEPVYQL